MKHLSWNCRGLGNPATIRALVKCLEREVPDIIFLMETKQSSNEMRRLNTTRLGYEGCFSVDCERLPRSRRGGICMMWRNTVQLELISYNSNHIMARIGGDGDEEDYYCTGIYGWPGSNKKEKTWDLLKAVKRDEREAWLCMGDFNEIMWSFEKRGGNPKSWQSMKNFRDIARYCGLMDLGYTGPHFTWSNGRRGTENIRERFDRALANLSWKNRYQTIHVKHLLRYKSDHAPFTINGERVDIATTGQIKPHRWKFRFEHTWMHHKGFTEVMKRSWNETTVNENFEDKILTCGIELSKWAKREFGSIRKQKNELTELLNELQQTDQENKQDQMRSIENQLDQILKREETMWFQRSRAIWLKDGDRNSSFFHQKASNRKKRNTIKVIVDEEGIQHSKQQDISKVLREYYQKIFKREEA